MLYRYYIYCVCQEVKCEDSMIISCMYDIVTLSNLHMNSETSYTNAIYALDRAGFMVIILCRARLALTKCWPQQLRSTFTLSSIFDSLSITTYHHGRIKSNSILTKRIDILTHQLLLICNYFATDTTSFSKPVHHLTLFLRKLMETLNQHHVCNR